MSDSPSGPMPFAVRARLGLKRRFESYVKSPLLWAITLPPLRAAGAPVRQVNTFFNDRDLRPLRGYVQEMVHADAFLRLRLTERRIRGQRAWEYGRLLGILGQHAECVSWRVLDVGPGNSTFPLILRSRVGAVTTVDYYTPLEQPSREHLDRMERAGVEVQSGSVLDLGFADASFDLVTCISAVEHLDLEFKDGAMRPVARERYFERTRQALREMMRVLKPGGHLYLTTEAYHPDLQRTDRWEPSASIYGGIGAAYPVQEIVPLFVATVESCGGSVADHDYSPALLLDDGRRANWRGRYITTFCLFARKG